MNKDNEPKVDNETKFNVVRDELVKQIGITYAERLQQYAGVEIRVISNEWDGGSQALLLGSDGEWSSKLDMMGWDIGENPDIDTLIRNYAEIKDESYQELKYLDDDESGDAARNQYLSENRDRLFEGLVSEMEARLHELKNPENE